MGTLLNVFSSSTIWQPNVKGFALQQNSVQGLKEVIFDSISDLYIAPTWITATDVLVHRVKGQERVYVCVCFGGLERGGVGLLQKVPLKDIWICLACRVDVPSCWERRSLWSFQSRQHWERDTPGYHSNSCKTHACIKKSITICTNKESQALCKTTC